MLTIVKLITAKPPDTSNNMLLKWDLNTYTLKYIFPKNYLLMVLVILPTYIYIRLYKYIYIYIHILKDSSGGICHLKKIY